MPFHMFCQTCVFWLGLMLVPAGSHGSRNQGRPRRCAPKHPTPLVYVVSDPTSPARGQNSTTGGVIP
eukprot:1696525-Rhodomonas_salina.1